MSLDDHRHEREHAWAAARGLTRVAGDQCIRRLLGEQCLAPACACMAGWADHPSLWVRGDELLFVSQPYARPDEPALRQAAEFARAHGLDLKITSESFHLPGRTIALEFIASQGQ